jgi:hypothetical protein
MHIYIYSTITPPDSHLSGVTDLSDNTDTKVLCYEDASRKLCSFSTRGSRVRQGHGSRLRKLNKLLSL